ncbi:YopX family protein [Streptococcus suis]|uniref:YopX family protein n=1 Tax=Streptococcus suis TaxID=1307 RepID=UPI00299038A4|nr:YopX family protein [Streptococcus suis]MDW8673799.1 YopX family protein [Streptococcus suis]MDW8719012.1 YopX family protein [Streptococcus suis]MDW8748889.1 YopX family protein [Streptococcus suis]MDW8753413.1 YopX family protein [Streptococcus suis]
MVVPKFRAWDKMHNEWSNGFFIYSEGGLYTPNYGFNRKHLKNRTDVYPIAKQERFILMHSTGLFDVNGKEIFEGDVVRMHSGELLPVKLHHGMFEPVCYYASRAFGRVGNVFENPELLEHPDFREEIND